MRSGARKPSPRSTPGTAPTSCGIGKFSASPSTAVLASRRTRARRAGEMPDAQVRRPRACRRRLSRSARFAHERRQHALRLAGVRAPGRVAGSTDQGLEDWRSARSRISWTPKPPSRSSTGRAVQRRLHRQPAPPPVWRARGASAPAGRAPRRADGGVGGRAAQSTWRSMGVDCAPVGFTVWSSPSRLARATRLTRSPCRLSTQQRQVRAVADPPEARSSPRPGGGAGRRCRRRSARCCSRPWPRRPRIQSAQALWKLLAEIARPARPRVNAGGGRVEAGRSGMWLDRPVPRWSKAMTSATSRSAMKIG